MLFLIVLYRRAPWPVRMMTLAVLFFVAVLMAVRFDKAAQANQERNSHVHTRRNPR